MSQQESYMGVSSNLIKEKISNFKEYESKASALFLSYAQEKNEIEQRIFKITELTNSSSENYLGNYLKQYEIVLEGNEYNEQKAISGNLDSLLEPFRKTAEMKLYGASILANKMGEVLSEDEIKELHLEEDENLEVFQGQIKKIKGQLQELKSSTIEDTKKSIYNFRSSIYKEQSAAATRKNLGIGIGFFAVLGLVSLILLVIGIATVSPLLIVGIILLGISILLIIILGASRAKMQTNNTSIYRDKMRVSYNTFYNNFKKKFKLS